MRALLAAMTLMAVSVAHATEEPCPAPVVTHNDADLYRTHEIGQIYSIRLQAPEADPGELVSCSVQIGTVALLTIQNPGSLLCYSEDVSGIEGRYVITRWCTTAEGDTAKPTTQGKFRVPGPKLY